MHAEARTDSDIPKWIRNIDEGPRRQNVIKTHRNQTDIQIHHEEEERAREVKWRDDIHDINHDNYRLIVNVPTEFYSRIPADHWVFGRSLGQMTGDEREQVFLREGWNTLDDGWGIRRVKKYGC